MLFRSAKRRTSIEADTDAFCDAEFQDPESGGLDRSVSVYRIANTQVVACHAEHYAGNALTPRGHLALDLEGLADVVRADPLEQEWPFAMTRHAHCEACFETDGAVRTMATRLLAELAQRTHGVSSADLRRYLRSTVAAQDPEWLAFLRVADGKWRKLAGLP